jgi:hypothetical protein
MVPPSAPRTNPALSEMVPERASDLVCNRGVVLLTAASTRHAAAAIGHARISVAWPGQKLPNLGANDPIFCAASSSMRRLGAPIASSRPNGRHDQKSGNASSGQDFRSRDRRSPLTTRRMSRIAKGSYCRARCSQKEALAQIAKSGGLRFRCQPCSQTGELREGWTPILASSYPNEASLCATALR